MRAAAKDSRGTLPSLGLGAVGVVFGDIGTSPLYTLQVAAEVHGRAGMAREDVFGVVSLILWALILAVTIKYVTFVMRADNRGEGGVLALLALLPQPTREAHASRLALLVIAGAALLFGDGMITPAISVLSAFEGLERATPALARYVVPLTCLALVGLFALQRHGTGTVGKLFGPLMAVWFVTIAGLGLDQLVRNPEILGAISPHWGVEYFLRHGVGGLRILGVVVLAITGGEALYADMGYFGVRPIRLAWFGLVAPALALSYMGQGALMLREPSVIASPFFSMIPAGRWAYALVVLAAMATAIASQALISGVFSLTTQAVQLGYFPRVTVVHTSKENESAIYVPFMNWALMVACLALVLGFRHSARLAAAYGIAVSGTMAITSIAFFAVMRRTWKWPRLKSVPLLLLFLAFDLPFFGANLLKFADGGYVPLFVGAAFFVVMVDWHVGRRLLMRQLEARAEPLSDFLAELPRGRVHRVPGTAIYLSATPGVPRVLSQQASRLRSVSEHVILLRVVIDHEPRVDVERRYEVESLGHGFVHVTLHFGYMERPHVPRALEAAIAHSAVSVPLEDATYYLARATFVAGPGGEMKPLTESLFAFLSRNTKSATDHFELPPEHVVESGARFDL